jgi:hypothetical protein
MAETIAEFGVEVISQKASGRNEDMKRPRQEVTEME